jgi:heptosyltransferase-2
MRKILVVAPNWLGDAIMALPAIADVRRAWPGAELHVAARAAVAPMFGLVPGVDRVITLPLRRGWAALPGLREQAAILAAESYGAALLLPNSFASALAVQRAGIPERWGLATDARTPLLTRAIPKPRGRRHQASYYQALTTALDIPPGPLHPHIDVPEASMAAARGVLDTAHVDAAAPIVVFAPGAAYGRAKQWVPERFAELAALLVNDGTVPVLVGSGGDRDVCDAIARGEPRVVDLCGRTDLPALAGVLARAGACVSNDSGAMHLAAAVGARVVAVFGATDERRTAPLASRPDAPPPRIVSAGVWCRPCMLRECPIDHRCMTRVSAQAVRAALRS